MKKFKLKFLLLGNSIAVSLDQIVKGNYIPLTDFYFWPQKDAWEDMKIYFESLSWISQEEAVILLNEITEVINCWQNKDANVNKDLAKLKNDFPSVLFVGYN
jgi:30S ribosomal protein 3